MLSYLGLIFQVYQISGRHPNTGQQRLYKFCYLLPFFTMIFFLKGCRSLFWESPSSKKIFNGLQHSFQVWQGFINISESFSYMNSLFILATTRKEDFEINSTFRSDFLVYLGLLNGDSCILRFLKKQNLAYQRLTSFVVSFYFIPIILVSWGRFPLCHILSDLFWLPGIRF
jgi:hypothetical protein